jgi:hypothetical protein
MQAEQTKKIVQDKIIHKPNKEEYEDPMDENL